MTPPRIGMTLKAVAKRCCTPQDFDDVALPAIADLQFEVLAHARCSSLVRGWIRVRGYLAFSKALGMTVVHHHWNVDSALWCDGVLIAAVIVLATYLRLGGSWWCVITAEMGLPKAILIPIVCQVSLYVSGLYDLRIVSDRRELFVRSLQALGATSIVLAGLYYWSPDLLIGRGVFSISVPLMFAVIVGWRLAFVRSTRQVRTHRMRNCGLYRTRWVPSGSAADEAAG
jgi:hypothetical protein